MIAHGARAALRFRTLTMAIVAITGIISSSLPGRGDDGAAERKTIKPFGIDKRIPLTTSKVVGSPDPPPPYRVRRVFPKLKINYPIAVVRQPNTDLLLFITEKHPYGPTTICRMKDDPNVSQFETLLAQDGVAYDIAFHPSFNNNGYVYIGWNGPSSGPSAAHKTKVSRFVMSREPPYALDPKSETVVIDWPSDGHNGGAIAFGLDGMLYVTSGDGTSDSDRNIAGQDMTKLLSKVLRIDVDHPDPGKMYSVPKDNPFVGRPDIRPETWAYGLRNPWRITVDHKTGHIWVGQNGQDLWEQAYFVQKGANYGWSVMEGSHPFYPNRKVGPTPIVKPTIEHPHSEFRSLTGGIVYYGSRFPELHGAYIYGDYSTGQIWAMRHDGQMPLWHKELADTRLQITGFGIDRHGEILICDHHGKDQGGFYTLEPTPRDLPPSNFPRTLSESGLFRSVQNHIMVPGLIPYSVNAPLWSDGAYKQRYIALPGADSHIDFTRSHGWNFPDGAVLVKSFALEMEQGDPQSWRWIETRFLTNQKGEWFGYSYAWNDASTEGTLVEAGGRDREFTIRVPRSKEHPDGIRKQKWHYPSRSECMVCHSRAANFVLGLSTLQMNRDQDYGEVTDNQLRTLEHIGALRIDKEAKVALQSDAKSPHLVDPDDAKQDLEARARSYLHANCAQCHVEAGGGNAQMDLDFPTKLKDARIVDVKPWHHTFGMPDARLVAPGHPERSVLLYRMSNRGEGHMPPLATSLVDERAVQLMRAWIQNLARDKPR